MSRVEAGGGWSMTCEQRGRTREVAQSQSSGDTPAEVPPMHTLRNKFEKKGTVDLSSKAITLGPWEVSLGRNRDLSGGGVVTGYHGPVEGC